MSGRSCCGGPPLRLPMGVSGAAGLFRVDRSGAVRCQGWAAKHVNQSSACLTLANPPGGLAESGREVPVVRLARPPPEHGHVVHIERYADLDSPARTFP